jgi:hypothetical protein
MAVVARFRDLADAEVASASLEAAGVTNLLLDSQTIGVYWAYSTALGGIRLHVPDSELEEARSVLGGTGEVEWPELPAADSDERCPACGQFAVELDSGPRKTLAVVTAIGFPVWLWRSRLRCRACGFRRTVPLRLRPELIIAWLLIGAAMAVAMAGLLLAVGAVIAMIARVLGLRPDGGLV